MNKTKWKDLTNEDKLFLEKAYNSDASEDERSKMCSKKFGVAQRTIRGWWKKLGISGRFYNIPNGLQSAIDNKIDDDTKILLISSAQNKTPLNLNLLEKMQKYRDFLTDTLGKKTQIVLTPINYRTPSSIEENEKQKLTNWWDSNSHPYLFFEKLRFGNTVISADSRVRPTAKNPLIGFEPLANENHLVLGSPKIHLDTLPRFRGDDLYIMCTTGSCTYKNYSPTRAGETGDIHHSYGFTIVELKDDGTCYIPRNVVSDTMGNFYDLKYKVDDSGVSKVDVISALVWGDIHHKILDENVYNNTVEFFKDVMIESNILHDVLDGYTFNPYEKKDMYIRKKKIRDGDYDIYEEVIEASRFPYKVKDDIGGDVFVIESNHDVFLDRYINDESWKKDLHNSHNYLKLAYIQQTEDLTEHGNIFGYIINTTDDNEFVKYIPYHQGLKIKGVNVSNHGDFGINGSKGSINSLAKMNIKTFTGHSHTPKIKDGAWSVGCSCVLNQYYSRKGMSTHAQCHGIIHENGKRQLMIFDKDYKITGLNQ